MRLAVTLILLCAASPAGAEAAHVCEGPSLSPPQEPLPICRGANAAHAPGVHFSVMFNDPDGGFEHLHAAMGEVILAAGTEWSDHIDGIGTIDLEVRFADSDALGSSTLAEARSSRFFIDAAMLPVRLRDRLGDLRPVIAGAIWEMMGYGDPDGDEPDGIITINSDRVLSDGFSYNIEPIVNSGQYDFYTVVLHEIGHVLGFTGNSGYHSGTGLTASTFDLNTAGEGVEFVFDGPNTLAASGKPVTLPVPPTSHLDDPSSVMQPTIGRATRRNVGKLDFAALGDMLVPTDILCWSLPGLGDPDADLDGVPDCLDGCPGDEYKADSGVCGCGVADGDADEDGLSDCLDDCPTDPEKIVAGECGCGVPEGGCKLIVAVPVCGAGLPGSLLLTFAALAIGWSRFGGMS